MSKSQSFSSKSKTLKVGFKFTSKPWALLIYRNNAILDCIHLIIPCVNILVTVCSCCYSLKPCLICICASIVLLRD